MFSLSQKIQLIYPDAKPLVDYIVMDELDNRGEFIAEWNLDVPQPSAEELEAAWEEYQTNPPEPPKNIDEILLQENADLSFQVMVLEGEQVQLKQEQADLAFQLMMKEVI